MPSSELFFLPLGGCREIGMNLNAYAFGPPDNLRWLVVDVGVTFADDRVPGVDLILPDPAFLAERSDQIEAIVLTHAHEDHIGAIAWLWPQLKAPIYATPFTAYLVTEKLKEHGLDGAAPLHILQPGERKSLGPFGIELINLTHSIPEPNAVAITTDAGVVLHTGDWKIDSDPVIGSKLDQARLEELGAEGLLAVVCDSTNVFEEGESGSEGDVAEHLKAVVARQKGRVVVTGFASNVARLNSICRAAAAAGRAVSLAGRSMLRIAGAAQSVGLLTEFDFLDPDAASELPRDKILYICTGSQGETNAALAKIARGDHPHIRLSAGDTVVFSSRVIPGNERAIGEIQNALAESRVNLVTERTAPIHVSGHPCRDELRRMYAWTRPSMVVPVHGEQRHIHEHARFAKELQIPTALTPSNGHLIRLAPGKPQVVDEIASGRLHVDGAKIVPSDSEALWERRRIAATGYVCVSLIIHGAKLADEPVVMARGLSESNGDAADESLVSVDNEVLSAVDRLGKAGLGDDEKIERAIVRAVRRSCETSFGKRPLVDVVIHRL